MEDFSERDYIDGAAWMQSDIVTEYIGKSGTQEKAAAALGVSQETVSRWKSGSSSIPLSVMMRLVVKNAQKGTTMLTFSQQVEAYVSRAAAIRGKHR